MKIRNIEGLSPEDLQDEITNGGRFVYFTSVISFIFFTLKRTSGVYLIRANETPVNRALPYILLTLLFGWWGIPKGPGLTVESLKTSFRGGIDVTDEVMATVAGHILFQETQRNAKRNY